MEIKYYNLESTATSYRIIKGTNNISVHVAIGKFMRANHRIKYLRQERIGIFFCPQIILITFEEFESHLKLLTDITESNEETFNNRVNEVARLTINYLK